MGTLLKFILFFVIFFWLSSKVIGFVMRAFGLSGSRDMHDRNFRRDDHRRDGIHVDYATEKEKKKSSTRREDVGEYIDYEEVKE